MTLLTRWLQFWQSQCLDVPAVPPLLIFIPLGIWAKLCAHLHMHNSSLGKVQSAGVTLAVNLLVQPPTRVWNLLMYLLSCTLTASVFYDFEFAVGPIIFYSVLCAVGQILLWYNSCDTSQRQDNSASPTDIVEFVNNRANTIIRFRDDNRYQWKLKMEETTLRIWHASMEKMIHTVRRVYDIVTKCSILKVSMFDQTNHP